MKNDLHIRTNFSASATPECSWEKVLNLAEQKKLDRISITDFDTCIFHLVSKIIDTSKYFSGEIIPGMECDVCENGVTFELLAYNFDVLKTFNWSFETYGTLETRQTKIKDILIKLAKEKGFVIDENIKFNGKVDFGHKYVYENLLLSEKNKSFFEKYNINCLTDFYRLSTTQKSFPFYIDMNVVWPTVKKVVDFIHSVGGSVILAHPYKYQNKIDINELLSLALKYKLDGIEVYHPSHTKEQIDYLLSFAKSNNLKVSGGSNFNGKSEYNELGIKNISENQDEITI